MNEFLEKTQEQHTLISNAYLPNAKAFASKNYKESNLYKLIFGISNSFKAIDDLFASDWKNVNILTVQDEAYIELWEASLGIPDLIFKKTSELTIEQRKTQIITKLTSLGAMTKEDMQVLANLLGLTVDIQPGSKVAHPPYRPPFRPISGGGQERFILFIKSIDFRQNGHPPYRPPFKPKGLNDILIELFNAIKPSNVKLIFI